MKGSIIAGAVATLAAGAAAQAGAWAQCGGQNWSGATTCVSGHTCVFVNQWYSQCQPGAAPQPTTLATSTTRAATTSAAATPTLAPGKFKWFGTNQAGGEFGEKTYPGVWGTHFIFPDNNAIRVGSSWTHDGKEMWLTSGIDTD